MTELDPIEGEQLSLDAEAVSGEVPAARPLTYRERRERKAERLREWADKRDGKASEAFERSSEIASAIPFGQPILVGHHSERRHRADLDRIDSAMHASVEHGAKADEMRGRADEIERQARRAIYTDDPDAVEQLAAKVAAMEARREAMKARNAEFRKAHRAELKALASAYERDLAMPHRRYEFENLSGNISRCRKRLAMLQAPERPRVMTARYGGECRTCGGQVEAGAVIAYYKRSREVECEACHAG